MFLRQQSPIQKILERSAQREADRMTEVAVDEWIERLLRLEVRKSQALCLEQVA
jgi:hypothetical protein